MALWHIMVCLGLGALATVFNIVSNARRIQGKVEYPNAEYFSKQDTPCPICFEKMSNNEMKYLRCGHALHEACFLSLRENNFNICPTCRRDL